MSTSVTLNNVSYNVPALGDTGYAQGTGNLSAYLIAIASNTLQQSGGTFTLTADTNFGSSFGLVAAYYKSAAANIASAGILRLANTDTIKWRNAANSNDKTLSVDGSDQLNYAGAVIANASGAVNLANVTGTLAVANGGTGITSSPITVPLGGTGVTTIASGAYVKGAGTSAITTQAVPIPVSDGGTGAATLASGAYLKGAGSSAITTQATPIPIADGGTNSAASLSNSKAMISAAGAIVESTLNTLNAAGYLIGTIVQVVTSNSSTSFSTTSSTYQTTNLTATITPKSTTHKILVIATGDQNVGSTATVNQIALFRGTTNISPNNIGGAFFINTAGSSAITCALVSYDSPASVSAQTYSVKILSSDNTNTVRFGITAGQSMILIEIAQ